jgi:peroxiredoxin
MSQVAALAVGQRAPDFRLRGPAGQFVSLAEHRGHQAVILVFFPLAFTALCSHQLPELEERRPEIEALGGTVIGVSVDSWQANEVFARQIGVRYPLLSDFHRDVSRAYGVLDERRFTSGRAVFIIDREGVIAHTEIAGDPEAAGEVPQIDTVLRVLRELAG